MAPSCPISTTRLVTSFLLILNITYTVALPNQIPRHPYTHNALNARAPTPEKADGHNVAIVLNDKKEGKNFFKELGEFLNGFDPIDLLRTILGGLMGFEEAPDAETTSATSATSATSPSPTTTVTVAPTPVEAVSSGLAATSSIVATSSSVPRKTVYTTRKKTVTKEVTATKASTKRASSSSKPATSTTTSGSGDIPSILPFLPPIEPLNLTGLVPTAVLKPDVISVSVTPIFEDPLSAAIPTETAVSEETSSALPIIPPFEPLSGNFTWPKPTAFIDPIIVEASATSPIDTLPEESGEGSTSASETEQIFSILLFIPSGHHISDNVTWPKPTASIETPETVEVVTTPVAPVPAATEIFSILPFLKPGEHLSDNVTCPTPTDVEISVPELPLPVITVPAESLDPFEVGSIAVSTSESTEMSVPLQTGSSDIDSLPFPLLEFVNGTYILPTRKPHFATPVLSPPNWNYTAKATITRLQASPSIRPRHKPLKHTTKPANKTRTKTKKPKSTTRPRVTKPIKLPPPLIRPTNFPLNLTYFANQTEVPKTSVAEQTPALLLTGSLRPAFGPFLNVTGGVEAVIVQPTLRSRLTSFVTVLVVPTPVVDVPEVSILGVDVPVDEPTPSDAGFIEPGLFPVAAGVVSSGSEGDLGVEGPGGSG
ncbi:hypothetical protein BU23DRAFT_598501 [Bimuria novae-zelandiae CBS 107.79]|uniref:Uncharacterized protein n=1 Tax=Bimuria novae-zelandiae CBS 107.79 TaxID=1447943 RepID=A0A6A5VAE5_9PLEO|nr:hypothetical protein BU23DRAFT_598501 [Bimuria novae-zelandiae CBS 107.79]